MRRETIISQLRNNLVAIISLIVAVTALCYTAQREEITERNRTLRQAGFEVLKNLGELQIVVNHSYYQPDKALGNPYLGWGHIALISDLSELLPPPVPETTAELLKVWQGNCDNLNSNEAAAQNISDEIDKSRQVVLATIRELK